MNYVALKHQDDGFGEWSISPKEYFLEYGKIPDNHANLNVFGMEESQAHMLTAIDGSDGRLNLLNAGLEILDTPIWYFDRSDYINDVKLNCAFEFANLK